MSAKPAVAAPLPTTEEARPRPALSGKRPLASVHDDVEALSDPDEADARAGELVAANTTTAAATTTALNPVPAFVTATSGSPAARPATPPVERAKKSSFNLLRRAAARPSSLVQSPAGPPLLPQSDMVRAQPTTAQPTLPPGEDAVDAQPTADERGRDGTPGG